MLQGRDILCISSIDWDFVWQGHQEIMATLAEQGNRVLFIENTGVRAPRLQDLPRLKHRLLNWWRSTKGFRQERHNLFVYSPLVLPFPYSRLARWLNRSLILKALQRWMRATTFRQPIVWTFLPTPLVADLIGELDPHVTIYYCIDDLASSSPAARKISRSEASILRRADLVFVTSERLRARAAGLNGHVHVFPFGVDYPTFEAAQRAEEGPPAELASIRGPVAGYIGGIHQWVDQDLLAAVARRLPEVSFVLVGPVQTDVSVLAGCPNIRLLGARPHRDLPRYVKAFDVGLVPYRLTDYTANVYPTKLNEYLAMGIPVISTDLAEIQRFNDDHGEIVAIAGDAEGFAAAVRVALGGSAPAEMARRIEVAKRNSWDARITAMSDLIEKALMGWRLQAEGWEETLQRLYRGARRRAIAAIGSVAVTYLLLFHTPFVWLLAEPLRATAPAQAADAIVVFAGGVGESGKAGGGYQDRVKQAVDLYSDGQAPWLIFSSGYQFAFQEAEVMRGLAVDSGVPPSAIILETKAANTYENVAFVRRILVERGFRRILLVSSPYHMRRALLTWRRAAPEFTVIPAPPPESQFYAHDRGASIEQIRGILHEYAAILVYWGRGWI